MSFEEQQQKLIDLRSRLQDPEQENPTEEEIFECVTILHSVRGAAQTAKKAATKTVDLNALFGQPTPKE